jgi:alanine-glyoxylate transaminase / serine-glyoxylate transaminase / serine-pyruvate transaminase
VFRIGHLGDFNDLSVAATLAGIEIGLKSLGIPHRPGGVQAALDSLLGNAEPAGGTPVLRPDGTDT